MGTEHLHFEAIQPAANQRGHTVLLGGFRLTSHKGSGILQSVLGEVTVIDPEPDSELRLKVWISASPEFADEGISTFPLNNGPAPLDLLIFDSLLLEDRRVEIALVSAMSGSRATKIRMHIKSIETSLGIIRVDHDFGEITLIPHPED